MAKVFLVHWHEAEAEDRARGLRAAGHDVSSHWSQEKRPAIPTDPPDVVVISLDRLPSHGRAVAEWGWESKKRRHVPIVFAGGVADKVAATRERFPAATFCSTRALVAAVERLARRCAPRSD